MRIRFEWYEMFSNCQRLQRKSTHLINVWQLNIHGHSLLFYRCQNHKLVIFCKFLHFLQLRMPWLLHVKIVFHKFFLVLFLREDNDRKNQMYYKIKVSELWSVSTISKIVILKCHAKIAKKSMFFKTKRNVTQQPELAKPSNFQDLLSTISWEEWNNSGMNV
jgi:hypothetical protein